MSRDMTLTEVLAGLGYTHGPRASEGLQGRVVLKDGKKVWEGTAHECWKWLRATGQYPGKAVARG